MDLNNALDFEKIDPSITIINTVQTDGSFLLNNLLSKVIRQKEFIIFLAFSQKMTHYKSIQGKLANSTNLSDLMEQGQFNVIDCMQLFKSVKRDVKTLLKEIYSNVKSIVDKFDFDSKKKICLFVDDLSIAHLIGVKGIN